MIRSIIAGCDAIHFDDVSTHRFARCRNTQRETDMQKSSTSGSSRRWTLQYLAAALAVLFFPAALMRWNDRPQPGPAAPPEVERERSAAAAYRDPPSRPLARFFPDLPLKSQLKTLLEASRQGDRHSACVLARALQMCRNLDAGNESNVVLDAYTSKYAASLNDEEVASLAAAIAARETTASTTCAELAAGDYDALDDIVYESATMGDPVSMRMFALQQDKMTTFGDVIPVDRKLIDRHRLHAEAMLNRAAEAGDPVALRSIHSVYATGQIFTPFDKVKVPRDGVKSMAAYIALIDVDDYRLKATSTEDAIAQAKQDIAESLANLSQADQLRLATLRDAYVRAYRARKRPASISAELLGTLPEQACANPPGDSVIAASVDVAR